ncbi:MAG: hypothetical protein ACOX1V_03100 [Candidatus Iainarchaeum sp.]|jgi:thiol-disulfide isomerase/thioredoxin
MSKLKKNKKKIVVEDNKQNNKSEQNNKSFLKDPKILFIAGVLIIGILAIFYFHFSTPQICTKDGKPIVRMYSTNTCPHCVWVGPTFESVVKEYVDQNKIVAHHWKWMINNKGEFIGVDDTLTPEFEGVMPKEEEEIFNKFSPRSSVPAFVFGCKESRLGNKFESEQDLEAEREEFVRIIEDLLK